MNECLPLVANLNVIRYKKIIPPMMVIVDWKSRRSHKNPANGAKTPLPTNIDRFIRLDTRSEISVDSMWLSCSIAEFTMSGKAGIIARAIPAPIPNTPRRVPNSVGGRNVNGAGPTIIRDMQIINRPIDIFALLGTQLKNLFDMKTVNGYATVGMMNIRAVAFGSISNSFLRKFPSKGSRDPSDPNAQATTKQLSGMA